MPAGKRRKGRDFFSIVFTFIAILFPVISSVRRDGRGIERRKKNRIEIRAREPLACDLTATMIISSSYAATCVNGCRLGWRPEEINTIPGQRIRGVPLYVLPIAAVTIIV